MIRGRSKAIAAGALALVLAACGSTADTGAGATGAGGIKTDKGVTDTTISLGIMGDTSGDFKNLGAAINSGANLPGGNATTVNGMLPRGNQSPRAQTNARACLNCHVLVHGSNHPAGAKFQR